MIIRSIPKTYLIEKSWKLKDRLIAKYIHKLGQWKVMIDDRYS